MSACTKNRLPLMQDCPLLRVRALTATSVARSRFVDGMTMNGSEPPSSRTTFLITPPAMVPTDRPAGSLPVSVAAFTRSSRSTCSTLLAEINSVWKTSSGNPASRKSRSIYSADCARVTVQVPQEFGALRGVEAQPPNTFGHFLVRRAQGLAHFGGDQLTDRVSLVLEVPGRLAQPAGSLLHACQSVGLGGRCCASELVFEFFGREFVEALEGLTGDRTDRRDSHGWMIWPQARPGNSAELFRGKGRLKSCIHV